MILLKTFHEDESKDNINWFVYSYGFSYCCLKPYTTYYSDEKHEWFVQAYCNIRVTKENQCS